MYENNNNLYSGQNFLNISLHKISLYCFQDFSHPPFDLPEKCSLHEYRTRPGSNPINFKAFLYS